MAKRSKLTPDEVRQLFSEIDETGNVSLGPRPPRGEDHPDVDPLSGDDPSGSKVGHAITRLAVAFVVVILVAIVGAQVWYGVSRRINTANLSEDVSYDSVERALEGGVEWGNGFTQFPDDYSIGTVDEDLGIIEVSVIDTTSGNDLELLAGSQIQATALSTNALLNDKITKVVYNVSVYMGEDGSFQNSSFFGFVKPSGTLKHMLTFTWTKSYSRGSGDVNWDCHITLADQGIADRLQEQMGSSFIDLDAIVGDESMTEEELARARERADVEVHEDASFK